MMYGLLDDVHNTLARRTPAKGGFGGGRGGKGGLGGGGGDGLGGLGGFGGLGGAPMPVDGNARPVPQTTRQAPPVPGCDTLPPPPPPPPPPNDLPA